MTWRSRPPRSWHTATCSGISIATFPKTSTMTASMQPRRRWYLGMPTPCRYTAERGGCALHHLDLCASRNAPRLPTPRPRTGRGITTARCLLRLLIYWCALRRLCPGGYRVRAGGLRYDSTEAVQDRRAGEAQRTTGQNRDGLRLPCTSDICARLHGAGLYCRAGGLTRPA
jgi:hypothetical protein